MAEAQQDNKPIFNKSRLSNFARKGKRLSPPLLKYEDEGGKVAPSSWMNDRLPNMLWAILLRVQRPEEWRECFRAIANWLHDQGIDDSVKHITHTGISAMPDEMRNLTIHKIVDTIGSETLRPLLLLTILPDYEVWNKAINLQAKDSDWQILGESVATVINHQSQEATDVKWMKVFTGVFVSRHLLIHDFLDEINCYPFLGNQREIRPNIRAIEIATGYNDKEELVWSKQFWDFCMKETECVPMFDPEIINKASVSLLKNERELYHDEFAATRLALIDHFYDTFETTAVDPRLESIFGLAQYVVDVASECLLNWNGIMISGRLLLRTTLESYITLRYLLQKESEGKPLWNAYREYGSGQYSLIGSKYTENNFSACSVDLRAIEFIANEDKSAEFTPIILGNWDNSNLRKISESVGEKELYDRFYDYTSGFSHASWGAIREASMQKCLNPLHRMHNIPAWGLLMLPSACGDIAELVKKTIRLVESEYPMLLDKIEDRKSELNNATQKTSEQ